ncbi:838d895d-2660-4641-ab4c-d43b35fdbd37 [Thermothielavioides terrestris]|uniref:838d895d-2660-4641-ab4c-d43b35fdbd37 n=1 Tax=Thermothielavioides terrestris TaxID=2587410 RepID=A0A446BDW4_9PEZI|nr:838d895d-2660-4641-ab4c-d43b35fdbd37 [Thermothielavioides terrestris]
MRLLKTDTLELVEFVGRAPPYVILSHTWGPDEVTFEDLTQLPIAAIKKKAGYAKIKGCASRAAADGYEYVWVDTCCIDKSSSAELSEAINSMYRWYQEAHICYAYMSDVSLDVAPQGTDASAATPSSGAKKGSSDAPGRPTFRSIPSIIRDYDKLPRTFENSRWFTRGWTLQELIAPPIVEFYAHDWREIGTKFSLRKVISTVTGIDIRVLEGADPSTCHVAERMSWAANRQTTRVEDAAYCLLGIFKVHMPLIYGEGQRAFYRLQEEIMKTTEDYTMLAWGLSKYLSNKHHWKGVHRNNLVDPRRPLAESPSDFELHNRAVWTYSRLIHDDPSSVAARSPASLDDTPPLITSRGLRLSLLLKPSKAQSGEVLAYINCKTLKPSSPPDGPLSPVCLVLRRQEDSNIYTGSDDPNAAFELLDSDKLLASFERRTIYLSLASAEEALSRTHNHRMNSLDKNLYILEKPTALRAGQPALASRASWKITSCFSHAVGAGLGHTHYEVPRKFTPATLYQPFDLPPNTVRLFAFEQPQGSSGAFGVVVGHGWCDVIAIADPAFRAKWGILVRDGQWNEVQALKFIGHVAAGLQSQQSGGNPEDAMDRVVKRIANFTVTISLKKIRRADINCESAIKILWSVDWD